MSPSPKVTVLVTALKSWPACAEPARAVSVTLAVPCAPPVRVTSTSGADSDSLTV